MAGPEDRGIFQRDKDLKVLGESYRAVGLTRVKIVAVHICIHMQAK